MENDLVEAFRAMLYTIMIVLVISVAAIHIITYLM